jgi:putative flavoprotein involved in K+ transport
VRASLVIIRSLGIPRGTVHHYTVELEMEKRTRVLIKDLPSSIPSVPVFEGEDSLDIAAESSSFLNGFARAIQNQDWQAFGNLFADDCWWKDSLNLTFDKRTLRGRQAIVEAWKTLSPTRKPCAFSASKDDTKDLSAQFARPSPALASLDVPFSFSTEAPKLKCLGLAKLIPKDGGWKIWILATGALSLEEHPFAPLPHQSPSMIDASQRGKTRAQGLPRVQGVLDAIVIGTSCSG